jgi:hypothetical protein
VSDALTALKNVVLMQERLDVVRRELGELHDSVNAMNNRVLDVDRRVARMEGMIEGAAIGRRSLPKE